MYFGTRDYMQEIPFPKIDYDAGSVGFDVKIPYLDGGVFIRSSDTTHREYSFSWNLRGQREMQPIFDYKAGLYGDGPIYFCDPFAMPLNMMPEWWAAPGMATSDAPPLVGDLAPALATNADMSRGYPLKGATYTVAPGSSRQTLYIPIPPGYTLWVGAHGPANTGAFVRVTPFTAPRTAGAGTNLANIPLSSAVLCSDRFRSSQGYVGAEIALSGTGNITLYGIVAQLLKTADSVTVHPAPGKFIGGLGHSGCTFEGPVGRTHYSAAKDLIGVSAKLTEVGGWL